MSRHLSADEISQWISGERTSEQESHLRECTACAAEVNDTEQTLALFRESGRRWSDHWFVERPTPAPGLRLRSAAAVACAVACLALLSPSPQPRFARPVVEPSFVDLPYVVPLAPYERAEVVRMNVSVAALEAAGLDVHVPDTGATVLADVVLGQDGRAHAIRLVSEREMTYGRVSR